MVDPKASYGVIYWLAIFTGVVLNGSGGCLCLVQQVGHNGGYRLLAGGVSDRGHRKRGGVAWEGQWLFFVCCHHGFWVRKPKKRQKKERLALGTHDGGALDFI